MLTFYLLVILSLFFNASIFLLKIFYIRKYCTQILYHQAYAEHRNFMIV
jgi:hypothetical protein